MTADDLPVPDAAMRAYYGSMFAERRAAGTGSPSPDSRPHIRAIAAPVVAAELRRMADETATVLASTSHPVGRAELEAQERRLRARADSLHPAEETTRG